MGVVKTTVSAKSFAVWSYLNGRKKYGYTAKEIVKALAKDEDLKPGIRRMTADSVRSALSLLKYNRLVKRIARPDGVYWQGKGIWPAMLNKKHGGFYH